MTNISPQYLHLTGHVSRSHSGASPTLGILVVGVRVLFPRCWWCDGGPVRLHTCVKSECMSATPHRQNHLQQTQFSPSSLRWCCCESLSLPSLTSVSLCLYNYNLSKNSLHAWVRMLAHLKHILNIWTGSRSTSAEEKVDTGPNNHNIHRLVWAIALNSLCITNVMLVPTRRWA